MAYPPPVLVRDLLYGLRALRRTPVWTAVVVFSLALGIAGNLLVFALLDAVVLRPLPLADAGRLVEVRTGTRAHPDRPATWADFVDLRRLGEDVFADVAAWRAFELSLAVPGREPWRMTGALVSEDYFEVLGVTVLGVGVPGTEPGTRLNAGTVVLGHALWQRAFGGAPDVVGSAVELNGRVYLVGGVAPRGFRGLDLSRPVELWAPAAGWDHLAPPFWSGLAGADETAQRGPGRVALWRLTARLAEASDTSVRWDPEAARRALPELEVQLRHASPASRRGLRLALLPANEAAVPALSGSRVGPGAAGFFTLLAAAVGVALVIACLNVANLLAGRAEMRRHEIGLRTALGAGRGRLLRQLLTESLLLAALAAAAALLAVTWGFHLLATAHLPGGIAVGSLELAVDVRLAAAAATLALVTGLAFGLLPAVDASRANLVNLLSAAPTTSGRAGPRNVVVGVQVALSVVLLVAALTVVANLLRAVDLDLGFEPSDVSVVTIDPGTRWEGGSAEDFFLRLRAVVFRLEGVAEAGLTSVPFGRADLVLSRLLGPSGERLETSPFSVAWIGEGYLEALGVGLAAGRGPEETDSRTAPPVALLSACLAREVWPEASASEVVGRTFRLAPGEASEGKTRTVVGVVDDHRFASLGTGHAVVYLPLRQAWEQAAVGETSLVVRRTGPGPVSALAAVARELAPGLPLVRAATLGERIDELLAPQRLAATVLGFFGLVALLLAAVGIFGVVAYAADRRTREVGVRLAFGASPRDILRLMLRDGLRPVAVGAVLGLVSAVAGARLLRVLVHGLALPAPSRLAALALVLAAVALASAWWPARRATRVEPSSALRYE